MIKIIKTKKEINEELKVGDIVKYKKIQFDGWIVPDRFKNKNFKIFKISYFQEAVMLDNDTYCYKIRLEKVNND